jgi:hypothetical protein
MYGSDFWMQIVTVVLNNLSWPIVVLAIVLIFKSEIKWLILHIKSWKGFGQEINVDAADQVTPLLRGVKVGVELKPLPPPSKKAPEAKVPKLPDEEIKQSRQRALKRIEEDTKKAGYQRGKLRQLDNGAYAVAWELEVSDGIKISDSP